MHGNPLTKWDGKDIWRIYDFRDFGILGEAFLSFNDISIYLTDTGRNWNGENNFKDRLKTKTVNQYFKNTADVIQFINSDKVNKIYLNCHPERWGPNLLKWSTSFLRDKIFNFCKIILKLFRFGSKGCV